MTKAYTLRSGEEVPIGVECAFPLPDLVQAAKSATRCWIRKLCWYAAGALLVLLAAIPPDRTLPENPGLNGISNVRSPTNPAPSNPLP